MDNIQVTKQHDLGLHVVHGVFARYRFFYNEYSQRKKSCTYFYYHHLIILRKCFQKQQTNRAQSSGKNTLNLTTQSRITRQILCFCEIRFLHRKPSVLRLNWFTLHISVMFTFFFILQMHVPQCAVCYSMTTDENCPPKSLCLRLYKQHTLYIQKYSSFNKNNHHSVYR